MDEQSERAYRELKRMMVEGRFAMGAKLREAAIAKALELSRTPVRHALNRLESEGFVVYEARRGHRLKVFTERDVEEIYATRALLESEAVRLVAQRGLDARTREELSSLITGMESILDSSRELTPEDVRSRFLRQNHQFHAVLYGACDNRYLLRMIRQVTELPLVLRNYFNFSDEQLYASHHDHKAILRAIVKQEAERAAALLREHVLAARDRMLVTDDNTGVREQEGADGIASWGDVLTRVDDLA